MAKPGGWKGAHPWQKRVRPDWLGRQRVRAAEVTARAEGITARLSGETVHEKAPQRPQKRTSHRIGGETIELFRASLEATEEARRAVLERLGIYLTWEDGLKGYRKLEKAVERMEAILDATNTPRED